MVAGRANTVVITESYLLRITARNSPCRRPSRQFCCRNLTWFHDNNHDKGTFFPRQLRGNGLDLICLVQKTWWLSSYPCKSPSGCCRKPGSMVRCWPCSTQISLVLKCGQLPVFIFPLLFLHAVHVQTPSPKAISLCCTSLWKFCFLWYYRYSVRWVLWDFFCLFGNREMEMLCPVM